jgi:hypothetical protein
METKELVISSDEYNNLPSYIKDKFQWITQSWSSPYGDSGISGYIKGKSYVEIENDKKIRLKEISETSGIKITVEEYKSLPINIKDNFQWIVQSWSSPYGDSGISGYIKGKSYIEIENDKKARIKQINETNEIKLSVEEFKSLPDNIKNEFQWIAETWSTPFGESGISGYTKGKSKKDIEKDKASRLEYIMNF